MINTVEEKETYLSDFARLEKQKQPRWLRRVRQEAIERFDTLGFPTLRHEEWRFTHLAPLTKIPFRMADEDGDLPWAMVSSFKRAQGIRLVFANGRFAPEMSG